jgi:hypothetical protein
MQDGNRKSPKLYAHAAAFSWQNIEKSEGLQHILEARTSNLRGTWKPYMEKKVKRRIKLPFRFAEPPRSHLGPQ